MNEASTADDRNAEKKQEVHPSHSFADDRVIIDADLMNSAGLVNIPNARDVSGSINEIKIVPYTCSNVDNMDNSSDYAQRGGRIYHWAANTWRFLHRSFRPGEDKK